MTTSLAITVESNYTDKSYFKIMLCGFISFQIYTVNTASTKVIQMLKQQLYYYYIKDYNIFSLIDSSCLLSILRLRSSIIYFIAATNNGMD